MCRPSPRPGKGPTTPYTNAGAVVTLDISNINAQQGIQGPGPKDQRVSGPKDQMVPGAASKVGDHPLPRDKGGPEKRTARDKYIK